MHARYSRFEVRKSDRRSMSRSDFRQPEINGRASIGRRNMNIAERSSVQENVKTLAFEERGREREYVSIYVLPTSTFMRSFARFTHYACLAEGHRG